MVLFCDEYFILFCIAQKLLLTFVVIKQIKEELKSGLEFNYTIGDHFGRGSSQKSMTLRYIVFVAQVLLIFPVWIANLFV